MAMVIVSMSMAIISKPSLQTFLFDGRVELTQSSGRFGCASGFGLTSRVNAFAGTLLPAPSFLMMPHSPLCWTTQVGSVCLAREGRVLLPVMDTKKVERFLVSMMSIFGYAHEGRQGFGLVQY